MADGSIIRTERKKRGLSQSKLSDITEIDQAQISRWELKKDKIQKSRLDSIVEKIHSLTKKEVSNLKRKKTFHKGKVNHQSNSYPQSSNEKCVRDCGTRPRFPEYDIVNTNRSYETPSGNAVALFAGCGGMSLGFKLANYNVLGYIEKESALQSIYEANFLGTEKLGGDIREISSKYIANWKEKVGHIDVVFGGPPCQGFSLAGKRDEDDPRNQLFREYARVVEILKPDILLMENVRLLTSMDAPDGRKVVEHIKEALLRAGYYSDFRELNAQHFGVPQSRERVFFLGVRCDSDRGQREISFPSRTHVDSGSLFVQNSKPLRTFAQATSDLESLESGERSECDPWHFAVSHPPHVIRWLKDVPEGASAHENEDPNLRPNSGYNTTYKRIRSDEPCSTIGTNFGMISGSRNVHPTDTRSFTIREAMRVQTFPDDFRIFGRLGDVRKGIGNAVPPLLAFKFANCIKNKYLK